AYYRAFESKKVCWSVPPSADGQRTVIDHARVSLSATAARRPSRPAYIFCALTAALPATAGSIAPRPYPTGPHRRCGMMRIGQTTLLWQMAYRVGPHGQNKETPLVRTRETFAVFDHHVEAM